ncbi:hypothetical protein KFK09_009982 [Dendrobium nobile]|uniref:Uncharacterized protein n=1 Tax=Dendrobium nobile TaxID=94219 RepID=A0A8T3BJB0_DENNO|nr:hypothetical protein KFK09_009982 [Dendrobium nobile]
MKSQESFPLKSQEPLKNSNEQSHGTSQEQHKPRFKHRKPGGKSILGQQRDARVDDVPVIAMRWSNLIKTGSVEARFMAVDRHTIMFTMERGQDLKEFKEFVLSQPEAYEMKIGEQLLRRPGDPPLDQVIEKLNREKETNHSNDEL